MERDNKTIFDLILAGEVPCNKVYEDEDVLAFHDISPQAPVHILVIPKKRIVNVDSATEQDAGVLAKVLLTAAQVAKSQGLSEQGYRLVFNNGPPLSKSF